jgi:hypothetical protein
MRDALIMRVGGPPMWACLLLMFAAGGAGAVSPNFYVSEDGLPDDHGAPASSVGYSTETPADRVYSFHARPPSSRLPGPVKAVFSPLQSALGRAGDGSVATTVNTDYKTRPANAPIPQFVRGRGINGRNLPIGGEDNFRKTMPADYTPTDLVLLPRDMCYYRMPIWLREEAAQAVVRMIEDARREGLTLLVFSGYRDYRHQARLKRGGGNVAQAGASEHQLGTTVDLTNSERHLMKRSLADTPEGRWLRRNAGRYGFVTTVKRGDVVVEPWHLRYFGTGRREREVAPGVLVAGAVAEPKATRDAGLPSTAAAPVATAAADRTATARVRTVSSERFVPRASNGVTAAEPRNAQPAASVYQPAAPLPEPPAHGFSLRRLFRRD